MRKKPCAAVLIEQTSDGRRKLFACIRELRRLIGNSRVKVKWHHRLAKVHGTLIPFETLVEQYDNVGSEGIASFARGTTRRRIR